MSPEVVSLELSKELAKYLPGAKTEYVWVNLREDKIARVTHPIWEPYSKVLLNIQYARWEKRYECMPTWQIHELLTELPSLIGEYELQMHKLPKEYFVSYRYEDDVETKDKKYIRDVRLAEALGKLLLWKVKN